MYYTQKKEELFNFA